MHRMDTFVNRNPRPGTIVRVPVGLFTHRGIVSDRWYGGLPMVISNSRRRRMVAEEPWETFANGGKVSIEGYPSDLSPAVVLVRARSRLGEAWDLLTFNCEHFVEIAHGRKPQSRQLQAAVALGALVVGSVLCVRGGASMPRLT